MVDYYKLCLRGRSAEAVSARQVSSFISHRFHRVVIAVWHFHILLYIKEYKKRNLLLCNELDYERSVRVSECLQP